jgi:hypothetical protein
MKHSGRLMGHGIDLAMQNAITKLELKTRLLESGN